MQSVCSVSFHAFLSTFKEQKFHILVKPHLSNWPLISHGWVPNRRNICLNKITKMFALGFWNESLIDLVLNILLHESLELMFVHGMRYQWCLYTDVWLSSQLLLKAKLFFVDRICSFMRIQCMAQIPCSYCFYWGRIENLILGILI